MSLRVAIVGAGLIGRKRALALQAFPDCRLAVSVDIDPEAGRRLARDFGGTAETDWERVVRRRDVEIVIVATPNHLLAPVSIAALKSGKHVLCEKPLGRNAGESQKIVAAARAGGGTLKTGFNHRHHPALKRAKELVDRGDIGRILYLRCRYGHGGRPGYNKEWRAKKALSGGGELLDQGVHVVDLMRWLAGDFEEVFGVTRTAYWEMDVEDNAFALFTRQDGLAAFFHTSWTQWKNLFSLEIFGRQGYLVIPGLGGSYGEEKLVVGLNVAQGRPPDEEVIAFPGPDISWQEEWREFLSAIEEKREPLGSGHDGLQANKMIEAVYRSARENRPVKIEKARSALRRRKPGGKRSG
ncbi:MAG: Gfo/Idh/MocA family oxidoreductase [Candidatus Aminicenantes bacterium]|nr:Gfo/Idh/MocA family oxidoreductase [Candidatus Aminicenantes bacterium]